jgi:hypothetical protein
MVTGVRGVSMASTRGPRAGLWGLEHAQFADRGMRGPWVPAQRGSVACAGGAAQPAGAAYP